MLTTKEVKVLELISEYQNEEGHSDFLSTDAKSKSVAGVISSLEKKGMIYDSYSGSGEEFKMWCLTKNGAKTIK